MNEVWPSQPLGDICDVLDKLRKPITKRNRVPGEFPYYGATGVLDFVEDYIFDEPLILIGEDGAKWESGENTAFAVSGKYWVNNHAHVIRPHRDVVDDRWIIHFLNHSDLSPFITGLTVPKLNQGKLNSIPIPIPPKAEQKRIVAILDEAFGAIDRAKEIATQNVANARELFESYLNRVFSEKAEGWEEAAIEKCFKVRSGDFLPKKKMDGSGVISVYGGNGRTGTHSESNLSGANVIIGRVGAKCGNARSIHEPIWLTDNAFYVSEYYREFDPDYLSAVLNWANLRETANQAAQPVISYKTIKPVVIPFQTRREEQASTVQHFSNIRSETSQLEATCQKKIAALDELKQSILQKAFTGQLTAKSPELEAVP